MDPSMKFWNRFAKRYSKSPIANEEAYQKKLKVTREYFDSDSEILELGCGTGSTAILHAPYVKHIRAVDFSSQMIAIAQGKIDAEKIENITFEQATVDELNVPDQSLDAVLALSLLHLLENREEAIAKVHKMLKPGGFFVTSTACLGDFIGFFKFIFPAGQFLGLIPMVKIFTTEELIQSLTDAGFAIEYQWQPGKKDAVFIVAKKTE